MRNLTLKCTLGRPMSTSNCAPFGVGVYGTRMPVAGLGQHRPVVVERTRVSTELTAARIQGKAIDLPFIASAPPHERRT